jgi:hypothetical protein
VCFISIPVPTGRELRSGSFTNSTPAMASTRVSAPATASFESVRPFAIEPFLSVISREQLFEEFSYSSTLYNRQ